MPEQQQDTPDSDVKLSHEDQNVPVANGDTDMGCSDAHEVGVEDEDASDWGDDDDMVDMDMPVFEAAPAAPIYF